MQTGLDRLLTDSNLRNRLLPQGSRFGLLAHPASVDRNLRHARRGLEALGLVPQIVFGPEHGYGGEAQDMIGVADAKDAGGVPIKSLYGERISDLSPRDEDLAGIDTLLVDLQDVGSRYYTFVWTAVLALRACAQAKKPVQMVILDRPNPIGQRRIEGKLVEAKYRSFVGLESIPVRHGLTLGEIVAWRAAVEGIDAKLLTIVTNQGVAPDDEADAWDRAFVPPSPNMPTYATTQVYPGGCLIEGTNLSEGRGTTRPFEILGATFLDGERWAQDLAATGLPGFVARPLTFHAMFHKHGKQISGGVQIHITDRHIFRPFATYVALTALAHHQAPQAFAFRTEPYEFVADIPAFDLLTGDDQARVAILAGEKARDIAEAAARVGEEEKRVVREAREALQRFARP